MTVFIQKGDAPMSYRQAVKRGLRHFEHEKMQYQREQGIVEGDEEYLAWANQWIQDNLINAENNQFNANLSAYRSALARLDQYVVAEGREEVTEEVFTGEFDEEGNEILETFVIQSAIDPVEPTIEIEVLNGVTGELTTATVKNPLIEQDEQERAEAQALIDATSQEVKDFDLS